MAKKQPKPNRTKKSAPKGRQETQREVRLGALIVLLAVGLGGWALFDLLGFFDQGIGSPCVARWGIFAVVVVGSVLASIDRKPR